MTKEPDNRCPECEAAYQRGLREAAEACASYAAERRAAADRSAGITQMLTNQQAATGEELERRIRSLGSTP